MRIRSRSDSSSRRAHALLLVGAAVGLGLSGVAIVEPTSSGDGLPEGVVATVNGVEIRKVDYERALGLLAADSRNPITETERRQVLDRLIEEELLIQRALELGFDERDRMVRNTLVRAMLDTIDAGVGDAAPSDEEVAAFYRDNVDFFTQSDRLAVRQITLGVTDDRPGAEALALAESAAARLRAGEDFSSVEAELGDEPIAAVPSGLLPVATLREYLSVSALDAALRLEPGEVSDPVRVGSSYHVIVLDERAARSPPPLLEIVHAVRAEMRRRAADEALRAYLAELAESAAIVRSDP